MKWWEYPIIALLFIYMIAVAIMVGAVAILFYLVDLLMWRKE